MSSKQKTSNIADALRAAAIDEQIEANSADFSHFFISDALKSIVYGDEVRFNVAMDLLYDKMTHPDPGSEYANNEKLTTLVLKTPILGKLLLNSIFKKKLTQGYDGVFITPADKPLEITAYTVYQEHQEDHRFNKFAPAYHVFSINSFKPGINLPEFMQNLIIDRAKENNIPYLFMGKNGGHKVTSRIMDYYTRHADDLNLEIHRDEHVIGLKDLL